jgi:hypothetical protein
MVDVAFFGTPVPLAGAKKPPSGSTITRLISQDLERLPDGRYLRTQSMENRCCNAIEVGARVVGVINDYGVWVPVENWGHTWY